MQKAAYLFYIFTLFNRATESKENRVAHSVIRIEPSKPLVQIQTTKLDRVLVDEWHKIVVTLTNTDVLDYGKINFACQLQTPDPQRK